MRHRRLKIPVCYHKKFGIDSHQLAEENKITFEDIAQLHSDQKYDVYMMGFLPGFAYLNETDKKLYTRRLNNPRQRITSGSIGLANQQCGIYPIDSPGGWKIIGRTPVNLLRESDSFPFLFKPADKVEFYSISEGEFDVIEAKELKGEFDVKKLIVDE